MTLHLKGLVSPGPALRARAAFIEQQNGCAHSAVCLEMYDFLHHFCFLTGSPTSLRRYKQHKATFPNLSTRQSIHLGKNAVSFSPFSRSLARSASKQNGAKFMHDSIV